MDRHEMTDHELDRVLAGARKPQLPDGFAERLQARLEQPEKSNVVAFPQAQAAAPSRRRVWLSALPLAASLAIGIYLGAAGGLPDSLNLFGSTATADATDTLLGVGIEDTESFLNGDLS
jgi:hypothetical protein